MKVYIITGTTHMGMDGDYTWIEAVHSDAEKADKHLAQLQDEAEHRDEYDWDSYSMTEMEVI